IAGEPRHLQADHEANVTEHDFGRETGKTGARDITGTGEAEVLVDDNDSILRPAELTGLGCERILPLGRLAIVLDLGGTGLAQIDDCLPREVARSDLGALIHRTSPSLRARRAFGR